jgi:signal transduction histidine kinase
MWETSLLNMQSNAFKFTFEGQIAVAMTRADDGRSANARVVDTGLGYRPAGSMSTTAIG